VSGGVLFQEALRALSRCELDPVAERVVLRCMQAARESAPLGLVYDCGVAASLDRPLLLARGSAVFFSFAAGNLADDIADDECTYLGQPSRDGPCAQFMLQNLFFSSAAAGGVSHAVLHRVARDLVRAAGPQLVELRTTSWTLELARRVGEAIAGLQYAAYLQLLWAGTELEARAYPLGQALGVAGHVAKDVESRDRRALSLPADAFADLVAWARAQADVVRAERMECLDATLRYVDPILEGARQ
jgi:hypothetical protein